MSAPLTSPAPRRKRAASALDPLRLGAMAVVLTITVGFSAWAVVPAFADDPANLPPVAVDDYFSINEDNILVGGDLCSNDIDPEGADLDAVSLVPPSVGTITSFDSETCLFSYEPPADFAGFVTFTYLAHDGVQDSGTPATATIEVYDVSDNTAPTAGDDVYTATYGQAFVAPVSVLANDSDAEGDALIIDSVTDPASGSLSFDWTTGLFTYTPTIGFVGDVTFTYRVWDGEAASNTASVTITVVDDPAANHPPVAEGETYTIGTNQKLTVAAPGPAGNDFDPDGDPITITVGSPIGGALPGEQLSIAADHSLYYAPPSGGYVGTRVWDYAVWDGEFYSNWVTLTIEVTAEPVEQATPVAADDHYEVTAGETLTVPAPGIFANDSDADSAFSLSSWTAPLHGDVTIVPGTGALDYVPDAGFVGVEEIDYTLHDPNNNESASATITITVLEPAEPVNSAPVANDDDYAVAYGETLVLPSGSGVLANDTDADGDILEVVAATDPASGVLTLGFAGQLTWVPAAGFTGATTFTYRAGDGSLESNTATVTITVGEPGENVAPTAVADAYTVPQGGVLTVGSLFGLLGNDLDTEGDALSVAGTTGPSSGTVSVGSFGGFVFTPPTDFAGIATFHYWVTDGTTESEPATVTITVTPSDAPDPLDPSDGPSGEPGTPAQPDSGTGLAGAGSETGSTLASTGSGTSALGAFSALLLVAIGGVVLRHRVRSRAR